MFQFYYLDLYYLTDYDNKNKNISTTCHSFFNLFQRILRFWLELGVDGFNIRNSAFLFEDYDIRDEPKAKDENVTQNPVK